MILVSYDGSADAQAAIDHVAQLMPGAQATVLTVWEPYVDMLARTGSLGMGMGMAGSFDDAERIDTDIEQAANARAAEGAERATAAGLVAVARTQRRDSDVAATVLAAAEAADADLVVLGTRGRSGVKAFLMGSVSHAVVQHADRAVLVVPSPVVAQRRHDHLQADAVAA